MIKVMEPQIKKALPEVITPERFTRMALSALNTTPKLNECTPMSFLRYQRMRLEILKKSLIQCVQRIIYAQGLHMV